MPRPLRPLALALALAASVGAAGCSDDRVVVRLCDDGYLDRDQVCLDGTPRTYSIGVDPIALRAADYDGDGLDDVLVAGLTVDGVAGELRLSEGPRLGELADAGLHGCSAHPVSGDIDGDAHIDLLLATCDPQLLLFHGSAEGRFSNPETVAIPATPRIAALIDHDRDGDDDLVVLGDDETLYVLTAKVPGDYITGPSTSMVGLAPLGFALEDADGDRIADLIVLSADGLRYAQGQGDGSFAALVRLPDLPAPRGLSAADIDGDTRLDLLTRDGDDVLFLRGDGSGSFVEDERIDLEGRALGPLLSADLDADGDRDVIVGDPEEPRITVWRRRDDGFAQPIDVALAAPASQLAVGDLNGDGALDLVAATFSERTFTVLLANP